MSKQIWCNGCFDGGLHVGHIELLKYAKSLGDVLICGIDSDRRVMERKGQGRPLRNQRKRAEDLENTGLVSAVFVFDDDNQLRDSIFMSHAEIIVVGDDWEGKEIIGIEHVKEVRYFPRIPNISTTQSIKNLNYPQDENEQWRFM